MKINPQLSFEFFPIRSLDARGKLQQTVKTLNAYHPEFYSVTFGAGGSAQSATLETVQTIQSDTQHLVIPHISCISSTKAEIQYLLNTYQLAGIKHLVVLRGDKPSGGSSASEFQHAVDLVRYIREETGTHFHITVAAYPEMHPEAHSPEQDLQHLKDKLKAGANQAITQYFYNTDAFFHLKDQLDKAHISTPLIPGIMPITNCKQLVRFSNMCGAEIPKWILNKLYAYQDDLASIRAFGLEVVSNMCKRLISEGVEKMHFYTLNKAAPTEEILKQVLSVAVKSA